MRALVGFLLLLCLGGASSAQSFPQCNAIPCKKIRIFNNSSAPLHVIIESGARGVDEWLQAQFQVQPTDVNRNYASAQVVRVYVNGIQGIPANSSVDVSVPFYSQLSQNTDGTQPNQFVDWWNGGRVYFYDDSRQITDDYVNDSKYPVSGPLTAGPCVGPVGASCSSPLSIFALTTLDPNVKSGLPPTDHNQLMEYTFADAITAKGKPYPINLNGVGYNISSVDQVYLPVAMEALTSPPGQVQYIGTVVSLPAFRTALGQFLSDFPGWPVYNSSVFGQPDPTRPRIPGAFNVFANAFSNPPNGVLTQPGTAIQNMIGLFNTCQTSTAGICSYYNQVYKLFNQNYQDYLNLPCHLPVSNLQTAMLQKIYGWVPFNEGCTASSPSANDLLGTAQELGLDFNSFQEKVYTKALQYSQGDGGTFTFNPYVKLIHNYLSMAAYAFSVDDAIGFQSYPGVGLIITYAGVNGLDNTTPLDRTKRVVVSLGVKHHGVPEWSAIGLCSTTTSKDVDPLFPSVTFYPTGYPCTFTASDLKGRDYQFTITSGPPNLAVDTTGCTGQGTDPWFCFVQVVTIDNQQNYINTRPADPDPPPSTHDFNGDGKSDILWRDSSGTTTVMWMMNGNQVASSSALSTGANWSIVGQRDFDRDGKADLLWRDSSGDLARWFLNGTGIGPSVISSQGFGNVPTDWTVAGTGDFNGDGFGDVLWRRATGDVGVWLMNDSTQVVASSGFSGVPLSWSIVAVAHFDTDTSIPRNSDILWRDANGDLAIWFMNGISLVSSASIANVPTNWAVVATGDFNGDGFDDILWRDSSGDLAVWLMRGAQVLQSGALGIVPLNFAVVETGDFNFDGKSDILWRDTSSGAVSIWFMNGLQVSSAGGVPNPGLNWTIQSTNAN